MAKKLIMSLSHSHSTKCTKELLSMKKKKKELGYWEKPGQGIVTARSNKFEFWIWVWRPSTEARPTNEPNWKQLKCHDQYNRAPSLKTPVFLVEETDMPKSQTYWRPLYPPLKAHYNHHGKLPKTRKCPIYKTI